MFKSPFSFKGRIRRLEYGLSYLIYIFLYLAIIWIMEELGEAGIIFIVFIIPCIWFLIAQSAKRCHDVGNSGFYQLIPFYSIILLFLEGDGNENEYGPNPKEDIPNDTHLSPSNEKKDISPKYFLISSVLVIAAILFLGMKYAGDSADKPIIQWSEKQLVWEDFKLVNSLEKNYVATIYSNINCPKIITDNDSKVYAYMNPNDSERLRYEYDSYNVLTHEQYHFNITEYCARLLRKDIVEKGLGGLTYDTMRALQTKYSKKLEKLQDQYDSITDHNADSRLQRQWELRIDDLLRQTAYYENEDIYSYYNFTKNRTSFFKYIYHTHSNKILTSYGIDKKDINSGESYEYTYGGPKERIVKFYKDGVLTNGGYFETAITKIIDTGKGDIEIHYLNADESYNSDLKYCLQKTTVDDNKNRTNHYFDSEENRTTNLGAYEIKWMFNPKDESLLSTYYDKNGRIIPNSDGIYHSKRLFDDKKRTIVLENYGKQKKLKNNKNYIARYELEFNENNKKSSYRLYDESGEMAYHLSDYHLAYEYDMRGNMTKATSLGENGESIYDKNAASIYEFTYDQFDRETSEKRYNKNHEPIVANDDYFLKVKDYDSIGRIQFEGYYYPEYVLKYSESMWGATKHVYENDSISKMYNLDAYNDIIEDNAQISIIKKRLNKKKEMIAEIYLDTLGNFSKTKDDIVSYKYKYNADGKTIETATYDSIGNRIPFESDVAIVRWDYDKNGNKTKTSYYNTEDKFAYATDSVTFNVFKYNADNVLIERTNYDIEMKPSSIDGVSKSVIIPNEVGLDSIIFDYNRYGKIKNGVGITKNFYNKYGNKTRIEYFNATNNRTKNSSGVSVTKINYSKRQQIQSYEYFDEYLRPTNNSEGIAKENWKYDELGHTVSYECFDKSKKPIIGPNGYHKIEHEWGSMGETSRTATYDTHLNLIE
ncbi:MAG: DUF805 domain-containing protein, partial [Maribacter sp.]